MKRLLYLATAVAFLFTSCAKDDPATGVNIDEAFTSMATIKGVAYININTSGNTVQQNVPEGTQLVFTIANSEYGVTGTGSYVKTATIGENGAFEVELPAREDGKAVNVNITGDPVLVDIDMDGVVKKQIFEIETNLSESIVKGLTYQKKITYEEGDALTESASWEEGTYTASLKYNNGKEDVAVPAGTEVKIKIDKDDFIPARTNNLVFTQTVGSNGVLSLTLPAPSLLDGGLNFTMESAFIADYITITSGVESTSKYIFEISDEDGTVYGGQNTNATAITFSQGDQIEETDILSTWTNATYKVRYVYDKDNHDNSNAYSSIPNDAKITITEKRSNVDTNLADVVKTMTYEQFYNNGDGYTTLAPDPAVSDDALIIEIKVNFLTDKKTGENASGGTISNKFKYNYTDNNSLRGSITTNGGGDVNQPDGSDPLKNSINIESGATQLTFNN